MIQLSRYEQETIVNYNEAEATAGVYTHNRTLRRKLEQWAQERPEECRLDKVSRFGDAVDYSIPKAWVHIYPPRQISEEQRTAMAERLKARKLRGKEPTAQDDSTPEAPRASKDTSQPPDGEKPVYIVEWTDHEGTRQQRAFDSQEAAQLEAAALEKGFDHVAILWETQV